jgi:hypothetical protein
MSRRKAAPLRDIENVVRTIAEHEALRDRTIKTAFSLDLRRGHGYTVDDIAEAAGLTRERIYQIVKEGSGAARGVEKGRRWPCPQCGSDSHPDPNDGYLRICGRCEYTAAFEAFAPRTRRDTTR